MQRQKFGDSFEYLVDDHGIATVTFNAPGKVNLLTAAAMDELAKLTEVLAGLSGCRGLIFASGKPKSFIAGAKIDEIAALADEEQAFRLASRGQQVLHALNQLPYPTIAAINGVCLGGGCELALACTYRVAADGPETGIGLPEVLLGIIPGFGGTQRLPRLIGLSAALEMILTGKKLNAQQAKRQGVVDEIAMPEALLTVARQLLLRPPQRRRKQPLLLRLLDSTRLTRRLIASKARQKLPAGYPAPPMAIAAAVHGLDLSIEEGLQLEAKLCAKLICGNVSKNLIHVFKLTEMVKKTFKQSDANSTPVRTAAVFGAGTMGAGIALLFAGGNIRTRLFDVAQAALNKAMQAAADHFKKQRKQKRLSNSEAARLLGNLHPTQQKVGFGNTDLVVEAIVEKIEAKHALFAELEPLLKKDAILATNTSSLSVTEMSRGLKHPERLVGLHFFNPVHKMPLVEVIAGEKSSSQAVQAVHAMALQLKKHPVVVKDSPGFLVNRLLGFYLSEALRLRDEGISIARIDSALVDFGMPMGPFRLMDVVGIDIVEKAQANLSKGLGPTRIPAAPLLAEMREKGWLGEKSGRGFYIYKKGEVPQPNLPTPDPTESPATEISFEKLWERPIYLMLNEACRCVAEKIVASPQLLDLAVIMGAGFPAKSGGLLHYAYQQGAERLRDRLATIAAKQGERFTPHKEFVSVILDAGKELTAD